jgi:hypothetical protein
LLPVYSNFAKSLRKTVGLCRRYRLEDQPVPIGEEARKRLIALYGKMLAARKAGA